MSAADQPKPEDEAPGKGSFWETMWNPEDGKRKLAPGEVRRY
jgi:hypothetical protein